MVKIFYKPHLAKKKKPTLAVSNRFMCSGMPDPIYPSNNRGDGQPANVINISLNNRLNV